MTMLLLWIFVHVWWWLLFVTIWKNWQIIPKGVHSQPIAYYRRSKVGTSSICTSITSTRIMATPLTKMNTYYGPLVRFLYAIHIYHHSLTIGNGSSTYIFANNRIMASLPTQKNTYYGPHVRFLYTIYIYHHSPTIGSWQSTYTEEHILSWQSCFTAHFAPYPDSRPYWALILLNPSQATIIF